LEEGLMGRLSKPIYGKRLSPKQLREAMMERQQRPASDLPTLTITFARGGVQVQGPIDQKGLCYMMLELARDCIRDFNRPGEVTQSSPPPTPSVVPVVGGSIALPTESEVVELSGKPIGG
jgi:hypothetical protein